MTKSLAERSTKTSAIKIIGTVGHDPDAHRGEMIKVLLYKFQLEFNKQSTYYYTIKYCCFFPGRKRRSDWGLRYVASPSRNESASAQQLVAACPEVTSSQTATATTILMMKGPAFPFRLSKTSINVDQPDEVIEERKLFYFNRVCARDLTWNFLFNSRYPGADLFRRFRCLWHWYAKK